jgi:hypothetical protein
MLQPARSSYYYFIILSTSITQHHVNQTLPNKATESPHPRQSFCPHHTEYAFPVPLVRTLHPAIAFRASPHLDCVGYQRGIPEKRASGCGYDGNGKVIFGAVWAVGPWGDMLVGELTLLKFDRLSLPLFVNGMGISLWEH